MVQLQGMAVGRQHSLFPYHARTFQPCWSFDPLWGPTQLPGPSRTPLP